MSAIQLLGAEALSGSADAMLAGYDAVTGDWQFPRSGSFWDVIAEAHRRGERGAGRRVAVIDGAFDLGIAALARTAGQPHESSATADPAAVHGTVAALLVLTIAPGAALDLYPVTGPAGITPQAIVAALDAVAQSSADVTCLSLGIRSPPDIRTAPATDASAPVYSGCPMPDACLCRAAVAAAGPDRAVIAAIGNARNSVYCPAIAPGVAGIGFLLDRRVVTDGAETAWLAQPDFPQSPDAVFNIMQPADVLGSSFAAPLVAGAVALGLEIAELPAMLAAVRMGGDADGFLAVALEGGPDPEFDALVIARYAAALAAFPHTDEALAGEHWCIGCALFGLNLFINGGMAMIRVGDLDRAEVLLRTARRLSPADPHAAANLGRVLLNRGGESGQAFAAEALQLYDHAIAARPGYRGYDAARAEAAERVGGALM